MCHARGKNKSFESHGASLGNEQRWLEYSQTPEDRFQLKSKESKAKRDTAEFSHLM